jgi:hypothetical protein
LERLDLVWREPGGDGAKSTRNQCLLSENVYRKLRAERAFVLFLACCTAPRPRTSSPLYIQRRAVFLLLSSSNCWPDLRLTLFCKPPRESTTLPLSQSINNERSEILLVARALLACGIVFGRTGRHTGAVCTGRTYSLFV